MALLRLADRQHAAPALCYPRELPGFSSETRIAVRKCSRLRPVDNGVNKGTAVLWITCGYVPVGCPAFWLADGVVPALMTRRGAGTQAVTRRRGGKAGGTIGAHLLLAPQVVPLPLLCVLVWTSSDNSRRILWLTQPGLWLAVSYLEEGYVLSCGTRGSVRLAVRWGSDRGQPAASSAWHSGCLAATRLPIPRTLSSQSRRGTQHPLPRRLS